ncbi:hypothetical protein Hanom_Chr11g01011741 [Helianthus anomalus]
MHARRMVAITEGTEATKNEGLKALVVEDYDWAEEITEAKVDVNGALMAKIATGSTSLLSRFLAKKLQSIPKEVDAVDTELKSLLNVEKNATNKGKKLLKKLTM